jgi:predicted alpha-1,6-mannanase (GH76 family)
MATSSAPFLFVFLCAISSSSLAKDADLSPSHQYDANNEFRVRGEAGLDRILRCHYSNATGVFSGEGFWQSANSLEMLSNYIQAGNMAEYIPYLRQSLAKTPMLVDHCYDDWQWWLHAWVHAYTVDPDPRYLKRAADIFEAVAQQWSDVCGGGLIWCPKTTYKNAITNELFLVSSMLLHPHANALGRPTHYYLDWAEKEWKWFAQSGMLNSESLINDGLDDNCRNNNQTTWTYNQGVLLTGLAMLANVTGDLSLVALGMKIFTAVTERLVDGEGVLTEPCGATCGADGHLFKGIFVRHLRYFASLTHNASFAAAARAFLAQSATSMLRSSVCDDRGSYGSFWDRPCAADDRDTATFSSALDLLWAARMPSQARGGQNGLGRQGEDRWREGRQNSAREYIDAPHSSPRPHHQLAANSTATLGAGMCVDARAQAMPACVQETASEEDCRTAMLADIRAAGYEFAQSCTGVSICRVRTVASTCPPGWQHIAGPATTITASQQAALTLCVVRLP